MAEYKVGQKYFYLGSTPCTIMGETLEAGGVNKDTAIIQIETVSGTPITFLYKLAYRYLADKKKRMFEKWEPKEPSKE